MARAAYIQNNFTAGEVSPRISMRTDLVRYKNGVETLKNLLIMPHGGITSRPGTVFVVETKDSSKESRLVSFQFSVLQAYIIEFGDDYFRFYRDNGQIRNTSQAITNITQANPAVVTYTGADTVANGDQVYLSGVLGMTEVNGRRFTVANVNTGANTFELSGINSTGFTAYSSGGIFEEPYEIVSPYQEADLFEINHVQSADVLYLVHGSYAPRELTRTGDTSWSISKMAFEDGPYLPIDSSGITLSLSATSGSVTVTASSALFAATDTTGTGGTGDYDRLIRILDGSTWRWLKITGYTSSTVVTASIQSAAFSSVASPFTSWRLGAWSSTTGFPITAKFYENRLVFGGNDNQPSTIWGSAQDDYVNHTPGTGNADAFEYTLVAEQVNAIQWMSPQRTLRIGTTGGEFDVSSGSDNLSLTPTNIRVTRQTNYGSNNIQPLLIENATLFWQRAGRKLREYVYSFEVDNFIAPDLTLVSEHISSSSIKAMAYQAEPDGIVWCARNDGILIGLTYLRSNEVVGWHRHTIGGTSVAVESLATIPITNQDQLWTIVKRTINGSTKRYIERLGDTFIDLTVNDSKFVDSNLSFNGTTYSTTLTPGAVTGNGVTFTAGSSVFTSADVGKHIRSGSGKAIITSQAGTTAVANIVADFASTSAIAAGDWTLSTNSITGLHHLEGETLSVLADGGVHPVRVVTNGRITLNGQYTDVNVGLGYTQEVKSLKIEAGSSIGSAQGSRARITELTVSLFDSVGMQIGADEDSLAEQDFRRPSDVQDEGVPLFTGEKVVRPKHGWRDGATVMIRQEQPLPLTILGYVAKVEVSDAA